MITKERLEELIEQMADIYVVMPFGVYTHRLTKEYKLGEYGVGVVLYSKVSERWDYHDIFETKEDAEEYAEFGNITRTERLELPSWEDVQKEEDSILVELKTPNLDCLFVDKKNNCVAVEEREWCHFRKPLTRENYNKARRLCVKLFRGEKDG